MSNKYLIIIEETDTGYCAYAPDLDGCVATAKTKDEVEKMMRGAIKFHIKGMEADGDLVPAPTSEARVVDIS